MPTGMCILECSGPANIHQYRVENSSRNRHFPELTVKTKTSTATQLTRRSPDRHQSHYIHAAASPSPSVHCHTFSTHFIRHIETITLVASDSLIGILKLLSHFAECISRGRVAAPAPLITETCIFFSSFTKQSSPRQKTIPMIPHCPLFKGGQFLNNHRVAQRERQKTVNQPPCKNRSRNTFIKPTLPCHQNGNFTHAETHSTTGTDCEKSCDTLEVTASDLAINHKSINHDPS